MAVRRNITIPPHLEEIALDRQADLGFGTFSDYLHHLIRIDNGLIQTAAFVRP